MLSSAKMADWRDYMKIVIVRSPKFLSYILAKIFGVQLEKH